MDTSRKYSLRAYPAMNIPPDMSADSISAVALGTSEDRFAAITGSVAGGVLFQLDGQSRPGGKGEQ